MKLLGLDEKLLAAHLLKELFGGLTILVVSLAVLFLFTLLFQ